MKYPKGALRSQDSLVSVFNKGIKLYAVTPNLKDSGPHYVADLDPTVSYVDVWLRNPMVTGQQLIRWYLTNTYISCGKDLAVGFLFTNYWCAYAYSLKLINNDLGE